MPDTEQRRGNGRKGVTRRKRENEDLLRWVRNIMDTTEQE